MRIVQKPAETMTLGLFMFFNCITVVHGVDVDDLLKRASSASNVQAILELRNQVKQLSQVDRTLLLQTASQSEQESEMILAAAALADVENSEVNRAAFDVLSTSAITEVSEVAWLAVKWDWLSESQIAEGLRSRDVAIRCGLVLKCTDNRVVQQMCLDDNPLVRAIAIRRLGKIADFNVLDEKVALARCLVDYDQLVRSNALLVNMRHDQLSDVVAAGMVTDSRSIIMLEDVFTSDGDSELLRQRYGIPDRTSAATVLLGMLQLQQTGSVVPPRDYQPLMIPLDDELLIGSVAGNLWLNLRQEVAASMIAKVVEHIRAESPLKRQLNEALRQHGS